MKGRFKLMIPMIERTKVGSVLGCGFSVMDELKHKFKEHKFWWQNCSEKSRNSN
jgi:hypothetical protein